MWVMTSFGILMPSLRPEDTIPEDDNRTMQIRTRREQDLEILREEYMGDELGPTLHTPSFDYEYRAYCTPEAFGRALSLLTVDIDYEKFKPTTEDRYGDSDLHAVYNAIWGVVFNRLSTPQHQVEYMGLGKDQSLGAKFRQMTPQGWRQPAPEFAIDALLGLDAAGGEDDSLVVPEPERFPLTSARELAVELGTTKNKVRKFLRDTDWGVGLRQDDGTLCLKLSDFDDLAESYERWEERSTVAS